MSVAATLMTNVAEAPPIRPKPLSQDELLGLFDGSDTGAEFVELLNCGRVAVSLAGWTLETGNGANPADWTVEWIGGDFDYLESGAFLLIGESQVQPTPDVVTALRYDAQRVVGVEINTRMIEIVADSFATFAGVPYSDPRVEVILGDGRHVIEESR